LIEKYDSIGIISSMPTFGIRVGMSRPRAFHSRRSATGRKSTLLIVSSRTLGTSRRGKNASHRRRPSSFGLIVWARTVSAAALSEFSCATHAK
jgi:hypothetical protein